MKSQPGQLLWPGLAWPVDQTEYYMDGSGQAKISKLSLARLAALHSTDKVNKYAK
jgi:hypothetical protein